MEWQLLPLSFNLARLTKGLQRWNGSFLFKILPSGGSQKVTLEWHFLRLNFTVRVRLASKVQTQGPEDQDDQRTRGPKDQRTKDQRTKGPEDGTRGTKGPGDQGTRTKGPKDQATREPADQDQRSRGNFIFDTN